MENKLDIKLVEESRQEYEQNIPDFIRFQNPQNYQTVEDLKYFRDEQLRLLFIKCFWKKPKNIIEVLDKAVRTYTKSKSRIEQVKTIVISYYN